MGTEKRDWIPRCFWHILRVCILRLGKGYNVTRDKFLFFLRYRATSTTHKTYTSLLLVYLMKFFKYTNCLVSSSYFICKALRKNHVKVMYACVCVCNDQEELPGNKGWREEEKKTNKNTNGRQAKKERGI